MTHGLETMKRLNDEAVADHFKGLSSYERKLVDILVGDEVAKRRQHREFELLVEERLRRLNADSDKSTSSTPTTKPSPKAATVRVILPASEIPLGTSITKVNGRVKYTLRDRIKIYGYQEIVAEPGTLFLIGHDGNASSIHASKELVAELSIARARILLDDLENPF